MAYCNYIEHHDAFKGLRIAVQSARSDSGCDVTDLWANRSTFRKLLETMPPLQRHYSYDWLRMTLCGMQMVNNEFLPTDEIHLVRKVPAQDWRRYGFDDYLVVKILKLLPERDLSWVELSEGRWE